VDADVDSQQGMCVLPWLAFDDEISFGDVTIAGWSRVEGNLERDVRTTATQILASFRDVRGNAVEPSLCWFSERDPTSLSLSPSSLSSVICAVTRQTADSNPPNVSWAPGEVAPTH
jgi:hypothetical protein